MRLTSLRARLEALEKQRVTPLVLDRRLARTSVVAHGISANWRPSLCPLAALRLADRRSALPYRCCRFSPAVNWSLVGRLWPLMSAWILVVSTPPERPR